MLVLLDRSSSVEQKKMTKEEILYAFNHDRIFHDLVVQLNIQENFEDLYKGGITKCCRQIAKRIYKTKRARAMLTVKLLAEDVKNKVHGK